MNFQVTVRHGGRRQRYHTFTLEAEDVVRALQAAAAEIPPEVVPGADLVELRPLADPESREYVEEEGD